MAPNRDVDEAGRVYRAESAGGKKQNPERGIDEGGLVLVARGIKE